uniref:Cytochrome c oxidase subunit 3 n=1 Tax=Pedicinus badii TaxID=430776 RepID=A0A7H1K1B3_9NEOP|nr:cytochrome c oxidase subunit 3 [Pedicinus badii]
MIFMNGFHPFHILSYSPAPIMTSFSVFIQVIFLVNWFSSGKLSFLMFSTILTVLCLFMWWRDVVRESLFQGSHTLRVVKGLQMGMVLFIISEVMFFFSLFFALFFYALNPDVYSLGGMFPPLGINVVGWSGVPFLNSILLLSSGASITWAHYEILSGCKDSSLKAILLTVVLGMVFLMVQVMEYKECSFTLADSVFGSLFFTMTGLHGLHVFIGVSFIVVVMIRLKMNHMSELHHFGFEAAAWYWHFVDVVWLLLYICLYWWLS